MSLVTSLPLFSPFSPITWMLKFPDCPLVYVFFPSPIFSLFSSTFWAIPSALSPNCSVEFLTSKSLVLVCQYPLFYTSCSYVYNILPAPDEGIYDSFSKFSSPDVVSVSPTFPVSPLLVCLGPAFHLRNCTQMFHKLWLLPHDQEQELEG